MQMYDDEQRTRFLDVTRTSGGKPITVVPDSVFWSGPRFVAISPSRDGKEATFVAMGIGSGDGCVTADVDYGNGIIKTLSEKFPVVVNPRNHSDSLKTFDGDAVVQEEAGWSPNYVTRPPAPIAEIRSVPVEPAAAVEVPKVDNAPAPVDNPAAKSTESPAPPVDPVSTDPVTPSE